jgi:uncharacterized membrane protein
MQWVIAFIAAVVAAVAEENSIAWAIIGFLAGYVMKVASRTARLERQLGSLRTELAQLKKQKSALDVATEQSAEVPIPAPIFPATLPEEPAEPLAEPITPLPPLVFPTQSNPEPNEANPWLYEPVQVERENTQPSDIDKLINYIWRWFTDGNTFVRIGIIILFVGVSFLLNLAIDRGFIAIELRLSAVAMAAVALLALGWRLRERHNGYGLLIQGGGVGLLYLTIFASYNVYHVLPSLLAFALLVAIVGLAATLAVLENALSLALFGTIGGFLAPILTSSGNNNYIGLFSFYAVLNAGVFVIAWFKAWRVLNLVGFGFTFSIAVLWGMFSYHADFFLNTEAFLLLFFLFYVAIGILYAHRRAPNFKDYLDGTLIFGTPILAFGLQAALVKNYEYGVALSAFALGGFYLALAWWIWKNLGTGLKFLSEALLAVSVIFTTLAIPFAVDGAATSATWAIEGTGVLWVSCRQQQFVRRIFALTLQGLAGLALLADASSTHGIAFANSVFMGVLIISFCAGLSSWLLAKDFVSRHTIEKILSPWLLGYSLVWLFLGFDMQIEGHSLKPLQNDLMLGLTVVSAVVLAQLGHRLQWRAANYAALAMVIPLMLGALVTNGVESHPGANYGAILWPLAFAALYGHFYQLDAQDPPLSYLRLYHSVTFLLAVTLLTWEIGWHLVNVVSSDSGWFVAFYPLVANAALWAIMQPKYWPFTRHYATYLDWVAKPLRWGLMFWSLLALTFAADSHPLMWLPFFNPLELMQGIVLITLIRFTFLMPEPRLSPRQKARHYPYFAGFGFVCLNVMLLRTLHHWGNLPWSAQLLEAAITQTCLSIFWTLTGLCLTFVATRKQWRGLWIAGAALLGIVVAKLFFLDLHVHDAIERIISFITVGMLLMLIGYFAPLPPKMQESQHES